MTATKLFIVKIKVLLLFFALSVFIIAPTDGWSLTLSEQAKISVLTCSPGNEPHSVYGHAAIRVLDPKLPYDVVFNYGVFSFNTPNFMYRFASGQTDYLLGTTTFTEFCREYIDEKRRIVEQDLNLTQAEKQQFFDFLVWNAQPENRVYRYNFFFDNCATRIRDAINEHVEGEVLFPELSTQTSFRDLIKSYHHELLWVDLGIDLVVAAPADLQARAYEEMFLPNYLMSHLYGTSIDKGGKRVPLISGSRVVFKGSKLRFPKSQIPAPFTVLLFLTLLIVSVSILQYNKGKIRSWPDYLVYGTNGLLGLILLWFVIFSEHPAMSPNFNLLWAMPFNIIFAAVWAIKKWRPVTKKYHIFISVWLILLMVFSSALPQYFNPLFYFFIAMLLSRSVLHTIVIYRKRKARSAVP